MKSIRQFEDLLNAEDFGDDHARQSATDRQARLTKPPGSLGRLEEIAVFLAGWQGDTIRAENVQVLVFAGNHGVTRKGISPYPAEVTAQMVANFKSGGAAINALTQAFGLELDVMALALDTPTGDISVEDALDEQGFLTALNTGFAAVRDGTDILVLGEMGIGNTTIAAALCASVFGGTGLDWAGAGTGLDGAGISHKAAVIDQALARIGPHKLASFEYLRRLGGRELCAIAGAVLAARSRRIPVILDGFVVCAAVAPLFAHNPHSLAHCLAGHQSAERAHGKLLEIFGLDPLLDLGMRLGEGSGAALATAIVRAAVATHTRMATFENAGVTDRGP
ncbi:MAG TPA: nicotinate-nucleotide--dimethylbenzimidazole phosphoribosyltransferase [Rhizomicrobium sp.]|jgi:nicotinate-nucleotide--dimethylbenzimidazole phosphoribosyltransferase